MEADMAKWQLQEAKARLSEVIKSSHDEGPQEVTVRGKPSVVVISVDEYEALKKQRPGLVKFMRSSPLAGAELVTERSDSPVRDISL